MAIVADAMRIHARNLSFDALPSRVGMAARTPPTSPLGVALEAARRALGLKRSDLQEAITASNKTLRRWEMGEGAPRGDSRDCILAWARSIPPAVGAPVLVALGAVMPPADAAYGDAPRTIDDAFHRLAEDLNVGPKTLRAALGSFLATVEATGTSVAAARARIAKR